MDKNIELKGSINELLKKDNIIILGTTGKGKVQFLKPSKEELQKFNKVEEIKKVINNNLVKSFFPDYLIKNFKLTHEEALEVCIELQNEGIIEPRYQVRCSDCLRIINESETISKVPNIDTCLYCSKEIHLMDSMEVLFVKVHK